MEVRIIDEECIGCAACVSVCPTRAIEFDDDTYKAKVDPDECTGCEECVAVCAVDAIVSADADAIPARPAAVGSGPTADSAATAARAYARSASRAPDNGGAAAQGDNGDNGGNGSARPRWDHGSTSWESPASADDAPFRLRDWRPGQGQLRKRLRRFLG